jgi:hypothetical protein
VVSAADPLRKYYRFFRPEPLVFLPSSSSIVTATSNLRKVTNVASNFLNTQILNRFSAIVSSHKIAVNFS